MTAERHTDCGLLSPLGCFSPGGGEEGGAAIHADYRNVIDPAESPDRALLLTSPPHPPGPPLPSPPHRPGEGGKSLAGWAALLLLPLLSACASSSPPSGVAAGSPPAAAEPAAEATAAGIEPEPANADQVMVTLRPAPFALWSKNTLEIAQAYRLRTIFSWTMTSLGEQCIVFEIPKSRSLKDILHRLHSDPRVGSAQPIATFEALEAGSASGGTDKTGYNDPYAHLQHSVEALHVEQAHRWSTGKGIKVAVIDTGVDFDHPDLRGRIVKAQSFTDRGEKTFTTDIHGTAVAGVIAASANNQIGIVGVAPQAELYALKACWQKAPGKREAVCDSYTLARAIDFAIQQGAQVLNFSLGGPYDPLLARLIGAALSHGIVVVAADPGDGAHSFPASLQGVIGTEGIDDLRNSNPRGAAVPARASEVGAPSVDILTTVPHGSYDFFTGSSFAAAQVSGVVALLLERQPNLTPVQVAALLHKTARSLPEPPGEPDPLQVDACAALASALGTGGCP